MNHVRVRQPFVVSSWRTVGRSVVLGEQQMRVLRILEDISAVVDGDALLLADSLKLVSDPSSV